jgi:crotonobetainyl-CoA:carnitine CoA-transferase CaiB-like acyl-CoA transferase
MAKAKTKGVRGRPREHAPDMTETVQIRCAAADREQWAELAAELGLQVGPWLRMLAMREVKKASKG